MAHLLVLLLCERVQFAVPAQSRQPHFSLAHLLKVDGQLAPVHGPKGLLHDDLAPGRLVEKGRVPLDADGKVSVLDANVQDLGRDPRRWLNPEIHLVERLVPLVHRSAAVLKSVAALLAARGGLCHFRDRGDNPLVAKLLHQPRVVGQFFRQVVRVNQRGTLGNSWREGRASWRRDRPALGTLPRRDQNKEQSSVSPSQHATHAIQQLNWKGKRSCTTHLIFFF